MPLVEGFEVKDIVMIGLAESDGESPMCAIMIVKEKGGISAVELL
jgi:hypothetical protein